MVPLPLPVRFEPELAPFAVFELLPPHSRMRACRCFCVKPRTDVLMLAKLVDEPPADDFDPFFDLDGGISPLITHSCLMCVGYRSSLHRLGIGCLDESTDAASSCTY